MALPLVLAPQWLPPTENTFNSYILANGLSSDAQTRTRTSTSYSAQLPMDEYALTLNSKHYGRVNNEHGIQTESFEHGLDAIWCVEDSARKR